MKIRLKYLIPSFAVTAQVFCARVASAEEAPPQGCSALTREAFDGLVATLKDSINQANTDCTRFCAGGEYASAPQANLDYLVIVRDQVLDLGIPSATDVFRASSDTR